jgi:hypothetical protein
MLLPVLFFSVCSQRQERQVTDALQDAFTDPKPAVRLMAAASLHSGEPPRAGEGKSAQPARNHVNGVSRGALGHFTSTLHSRVQRSATS